MTWLPLVCGGASKILDTVAKQQDIGFGEVSLVPARIWTVHGVSPYSRQRPPIKSVPRIMIRLLASIEVPAGSGAVAAQPKVCARDALG